MRNIRVRSIVLKGNRGRLYEIRKKRSRGGSGVNQHTKKEELPHSEAIPQSNATSKKIANELNVSHATIERDAQFSRAVQKVAQASDDPVEARQVLLRDNKITAKDTVKLGAIAEANPVAAKNVLAQVKQAPTPKAVNAIIREAHQQMPKPEKELEAKKRYTDAC